MLLLRNSRAKILVIEKIETITPTIKGSVIELPNNKQYLLPEVTTHQVIQWTYKETDIEPHNVDWSEYKKSQGDSLQ